MQLGHERGCGHRGVPRVAQFAAPGAETAGASCAIGVGAAAVLAFESARGCLAVVADEAIVAGAADVVHELLAVAVTGTTVCAVDTEGRLTLRARPAVTALALAIDATTILTLLAIAIEGTSARGTNRCCAYRCKHKPKRHFMLRKSAIR